MLQCFRASTFHKYFPSIVYKIQIFVVCAGGVMGMRYALPEVLLNPFISDSFGFSHQDTSLYFTMFIITIPTGALIV